MNEFHIDIKGDKVAIVPPNSFTNREKTDGWDEAIIPYDARIKYAKGIYEGENHILDDELEMYFTSIMSKIEPKRHYKKMLLNLKIKARWI